MAGKDTADISTTLTSNGATNGLLTVTSTTGLYPKMKGWIQPAVGNPSPIIITEIVSSTQLRVRVYQIPGNYQLVPPVFGTSDMSAFLTGAVIYFEAQFVYGLK